VDVTSTATSSVASELLAATGGSVAVSSGTSVASTEISTGVGVIVGSAGCSVGVAVGVAVAGSSVGCSGVAVASTSVASDVGVSTGSVGDASIEVASSVGGTGVLSSPPIAATATPPDSSVAVGGTDASVGVMPPLSVVGVRVLSRV
jgi:hypothetical protein